MKIYIKSVTILLAISLLFIILAQNSVVFGYSKTLIKNNNTNDIYGLIRAPKAQRPGMSLFTYNIVPMDRTRDLESIVQKAKELPHSGFTGGRTRFAISPRYTAPYEAGLLHPDDIADAVNAVKMVRYIAGLPYETISFPSEINNIAQHGAVLMSASNQFSHAPYKPADMDDTFFELAYKGCSEANISWGVNNLSKAVLEFIADRGANNIERAGHRRWILQPGTENFGMGYASKNGTSSTDKISMYVFDGPGPWRCEADSYVAWPNSGDFPIQYFINDTNLSKKPPYPWSLNLGAQYMEPSKENICLKLTRARDGKIWIFDKNTPNLGETGLTDDFMHLAVDNRGFGMIKAIIFRPDVTSLGSIRDGDVFKVELSGIQYADGSPAILTYEIRFFDLEKEMSRSRINFIVRHNGLAVPGASITIDGQTLTTDANGTAAIRVNNNKSYNYTVTKAGYNTETGSISVATSEVTQTIDISISAGNAVSADLSKINNIDGVVSITVNYNFIERDCYTLLAIYDGDMLIDLSSAFSPKDSESIDFEIKKVFESKEYTVKVFFFDGINTIKPLSKPLIERVNL